MALKLNENYVKDFIRDDEYAHIQPLVNAAHDLLTSKTGAGNDFLGWATLPFDYDKKEFEQIKKSAEQIKKSYDIRAPCIGLGTGL